MSISSEYENLNQFRMNERFYANMFKPITHTETLKMKLQRIC